MSIPLFQRLSLFFFPVMALIDSRHTCARSADMVEYGFGNFESHPQSLEPRCEGPAKVVKPPRRNRISTVFAYQAVKLLLTFVVTGEVSTG